MEDFGTESTVLNAASNRSNDVFGVVMHGMITLSCWGAYNDPQMTPNGIKRFAELFFISTQEYSSRYLMAITSIEHLVDAPHNGYFDETVKEDVMGVAGWIGTHEGWNSLEDRWRRALPKEANG